MTHDLPKLPVFFKLIPFDAEKQTFRWDEALPQNFETVTEAEDAGDMVMQAFSERDGGAPQYVVMRVEQEFVSASFKFKLVSGTVQ